MSIFLKKYRFGVLVFFVVLVFFSHLTPSSAEQKFSITDGNIFQRIGNFFSNLVNGFVNLWKKNIGEPLSRVWDKIRFFFINEVMNRGPEIKKEAIKEVGEMKENIPKITEPFIQKTLNFFKR